MHQIPAFARAAKRGEVIPLPEAAVYIITEPRERFTKVGMSENPVKRLAGLQTANPFPLHLVYASPHFERWKAAQIERLIHEHLSQYAMQGEWFSCDANTALAAMIAVGLKLTDPGDVI
jgi:hypothetical protein